MAATGVLGPFLGSPLQIGHFQTSENRNAIQQVFAQSDLEKQQAILREVYDCARTNKQPVAYRFTARLLAQLPNPPNLLLSSPILSFMNERTTDQELRQAIADNDALHELVITRYERMSIPAERLELTKRTYETEHTLALNYPVTPEHQAALLGPREPSTPTPNSLSEICVQNHVNYIEKLGRPVREVEIVIFMDKILDQTINAPETHAFITTLRMVIETLQPMDKNAAFNLRLDMRQGQDLSADGVKALKDFRYLLKNGLYEYCSGAGLHLFSVRHVSRMEPYIQKTQSEPLERVFEQPKHNTKFIIEAYFNPKGEAEKESKKIKTFFTQCENVVVPVLGGQINAISASNILQKAQTLGLVG